MFDESAVLDGLNEQQRRAATHQGGPLLVLAGAGTGKTRTLVARAAWLRGSQGVPASRILLLTFTRRAASDMLARAAAWFDGMALGDPGGLAEEHRLFYVAVTRARDHVCWYAPQRLHYHRRGRDDRHGFGQLTRFLDAGAMAVCDSVTAAPLAPVLPAVGSLATKVDMALGALWDG